MRLIKDRLKSVSFRNQIIGLDIGCGTIKYVVLKDKGPYSPCEFRGYNIGFIPSGSIKNHRIQTSQLALCIKELLTKTSVSAKYCVVAVPEHLVINKWVYIDSSAVDNIEFAVHLAVEEHIPCSLDSIYFDYQVFSRKKDRKYLSVLVIACRKEHVDERIEVIQQANLIPLAIEINSHAIKRAYSYLYPEAVAPFIIIDIGVTQLTVFFQNKRKIVISFTESYIFSDRKNLLQRIKCCIYKLSLSYPHAKFNKILFIGGNTLLLKFLVENLNDLYGFTSQVIALNELFPSANVLNKKFIEQFPALFLSFGLALRGLYTACK